MERAASLASAPTPVHASMSRIWGANMVESPIIARVRMHPEAGRESQMKRADTSPDIRRSSDDNSIPVHVLSFVELHAFCRTSGPAILIPGELWPIPRACALACLRRASVCACCSRVCSCFVVRPCVCVCVHGTIPPG